LLSLTVGPPEDKESTWYEAIFFGVLSPFQRGTTFVGQNSKNIFNKYVLLMNVAEENLLLRQKQQQLEAQLLLLRKIGEENNRLRSLLKFKEARLWESVAARVIAHNPQAEFRLLTIDRGSQAGLKKRMPVVSSQGLIGQIYRVGRSSSQVLLLTDPTSAVDARLMDTRARGLIRGRVLSTKWDRNYFITALEYVDRISLISVGGMVLTSGLDGVFPEGIPIGTVREVHEDSYGIFQEAEVVPLTDFMALREVLVITEWED
jgi:rod shape-determining protein MreC